VKLFFNSASFVYIHVPEHSRTGHPVSKGCKGGNMGHLMAVRGYSLREKATYLTEISYLRIVLSF